MVCMLQKLSPVWDSLAKSLEHDTTVTIGKIDCTVHRTVCNDFDIKGYPTLLWIEDGKKVPLFFFFVQFILLPIANTVHE
ncbi:hypothetical protein PR048_006451 [Dryococelus australis]|uniref:Thioredoxin domain-containing protein n=1 Tax=Dryococelus australis TaxID=614101 RepID=A0ABQ9IB02_9NEOP|nr:hypothetical protein PR048_006451 [Dryococelus australis]